MNGLMPKGYVTAVLFIVQNVLTKSTVLNVNQTLFFMTIAVLTPVSRTWMLVVLISTYLLRMIQISNKVTVLKSEVSGVFFS